MQCIDLVKVLFVLLPSKTEKLGHSLANKIFHKYTFAQYSHELDQLFVVWSSLDIGVSEMTSCCGEYGHTIPQLGLFSSHPP